MLMIEEASRQYEIPAYIRTVFGYAIYLPELFVLGAGIYGFLQSGLWDDMRMIPQSLPPLSSFLFYMEHMGMIGGMCCGALFDSRGSNVKGENEMKNRKKLITIMTML